ncbi:hypothetical protein RB195_011374 [Necator americanus]|uniref:Uncharacterized protein n=1 Tax=Necator americanus TaxID=51031 RepID=A0ABR1D225_NECAM
MSASILQHWTEDATETEKRKTIRPLQEKPVQERCHLRRLERSDLPRCQYQRTFSMIPARHRRRYKIGITSNVEEAWIPSLGTLCHANQDGRRITDEDARFGC